MGVLVVLALTAMEIHATGACPAAADVQRRLAPLLSPGFEAHTSDVVTIEQGADETVTLLLDGPDGGAIAHRRLPRAATCGDQAERVAVTLAAWEAQLHPEIALRLDRLAPTGEAPVAPPPRARVAAERAPTPPVPGAATPAVGHAPTIAGATEPPPPTRAVASLGVATFGDWQPGSIAPGARVDLTLGPEASPWRGRLGLVGVGRHTQSLRPGEARWWRLYMTLGADASVRLGRQWAAVIGAAGIAGIAVISGAGYSSNRSTRSADVGGELLARLEWRRGSVRPWLGVALATWLRRQDLAVTGVSTPAALPRAEPSAALGADFVW